MQGKSVRSKKIKKQSYIYVGGKGLEVKKEKKYSYIYVGKKRQK